MLTRSRALVALAAVLALSSLVSVAEAKKHKSIKPADGAYLSETRSDGQALDLVVLKRKVTAVDLQAKFKQKDGTICRVDPAQIGDIAGFSMVPKKQKQAKIKKSNGKFSFSVKGRKGSPSAGIKGKVSGRFSSKTKAKVKIKLTRDSCSTGKRKFKVSGPAAEG